MQLPSLKWSRAGGKRTVCLESTALAPVSCEVGGNPAAKKTILLLPGFLQTSCRSGPSTHKATEWDRPVPRIAWSVLRSPCHHLVAGKATRANCRLSNRPAWDSSIALQEISDCEHKCPNLELPTLGALLNARPQQTAKLGDPCQGGD